MTDYFLTLKRSARGRKIALYGMGLLSVEAFHILRSYGISVEFFIDRNCDWTKQFLGKPVFSSAYLDRSEHYVIVIPPQYYLQISSILFQSGFRQQEDFCKWDSLCCEDFYLDGISIGRHSHGFFAFADCLGESTKNYISSIGRFVSINKTAFMGADHRISLSTSHEVYRIAEIEEEFEEFVSSRDRVMIGNDVWIGANTFINASKVRTIGDGAIIGAGAVVISDVPPFAIVGGVPAKILRYRFKPDQVEVLQKVRWWEWDDVTIRERAKYFLDVSSFFQHFQQD